MILDLSDSSFLTWGQRVSEWASFLPLVLTFSRLYMLKKLIPSKHSTAHSGTCIHYRHIHTNTDALLFRGAGCNKNSKNSYIIERCGNTGILWPMVSEQSICSLTLSLALSIILLTCCHIYSFVACVAKLALYPRLSPWFIIHYVISSLLARFLMWVMFSVSLRAWMGQRN